MSRLRSVMSERKHHSVLWQQVRSNYAMEMTSTDWEQPRKDR